MTGSDKQTQKSERLAAALRRNLKQRKQQARQRAGSGSGQSLAPPSRTKG